MRHTRRLAELNAALAEAQAAHQGSKWRAIEAERRLREAQGRVVAVVELAKIAANNWHSLRYGDHPHDFAEQCNEPVFVRLYAHLSAPAAPAPDRSAPTGLVGDGVTDNTAALQALVDAAGAAPAALRAQVEAPELAAIRERAAAYIGCKAASDRRALLAIIDKLSGAAPAAGEE